MAKGSVTVVVKRAVVRVVSPPSRHASLLPAGPRLEATQGGSVLYLDGAAVGGRCVRFCRPQPAQDPGRPAAALTESGLPRTVFSNHSGVYE